MTINNKRLFFVSVFLTIYFLFLFLNAYVLGIDGTILGFLQELLTIPLLLVLLFFLLLSIDRIRKSHSPYDRYLLIACFLFSIIAISTFGSLAASIIER